MKTNVLPKIKIASPCSARWEEMAGDEQSRFCTQCDKRVYNFTQMSAEQISGLILEKEGRLCVRFYQRADGTMLTEDCPVGAGRFVRKVKLAACTVVALFVFGFAVLAVSVRADTRSKAVSRIEILWDEAVWKVKGWLGIQTTVVMGKICIPIAPAQSAQTTTTTTNK
jgi:hypothetical protein